MICATPPMRNPSTLGRTLAQNLLRGDRVYPIPPTPLPLHDPPPAIWLKTRKNTCKMQKDAFYPHPSGSRTTLEGSFGVIRDIFLVFLRCFLHGNLKNTYVFATLREKRVCFCYFKAPRLQNHRILPCFLHGTFKIHPRAKTLNPNPPQGQNLEPQSTPGPKP